MKAMSTRRSRIVAIAIFCGAVLIGCEQPDSTYIRPDAELLISLDPKNAVADAEKAIAAGDTRILVYYGLGASLPGIDVQDVPDFDAAKRKYGFRDIRAFDDPTSSAEMNLLVNSSKYVEIYNKTIVSESERKSP